MNSEVSPIECTHCNKGNAVPSAFSDHYNKGRGIVFVNGLECFRCQICDEITVFPDQIRRNEKRIAAAKGESNE